MDKYLKFLKSCVDKKRLKHSVATAKTAVELARIHGADEKKAYIAGLLHDAAKGRCSSGLTRLAEEYGEKLDAYEHFNPELIHGKVGEAELAALRLGGTKFETQFLPEDFQ